MYDPKGELGLDTVLAWAVEVEPAQLIANLLTYKKLLSVLLTLRACNRFGRGANAHINKLPTELVHLIEGELMRSEGRYNLEDWRLRSECATYVEEDYSQLETIKHFLDHLDPDTRSDVELDWAGQCVPCNRRDWAGRYCDACQTLDDKGLAVALEDAQYCKAFVKWFNRQDIDDHEMHLDYKYDWLHKAHNHKLIDDECKQLLNTCFGLETWTVVTRQNGKNGDGALTGTDKTTMHLILPLCTTRGGGAATKFEITDMMSWSLGTQQCLRLSVLPVLSDDVQLRFARALSCLHLQQHHASDVRECTLASDAVKSQKLQKGPSLLLLCRAKVEVD